MFLKRNWLLLLCLCIPALASAQATDKLNIVFIGNSITQGALLEHPKTDAPPVQTGLWLGQQKGITEVNISNQGVSGYTTVDFLPASGTCFPKVKDAMKELTAQHPDALQIFSIMLGTNDSADIGPNGSPVSAPQYYTNVKAIIDELLSSFPKALFILHRPIWYSPNTYNGAKYLTNGQKRLESYYPRLQQLVKDYGEKQPGHVFMGDTEATAYFQAQHLSELVPEQGYAGTFYLHPNKKGAANLAAFWGRAIYKVVADK